MLWPSVGDEHVEPGCDSFTTHFKEFLVGGGVEQLWIKRYLLDAEPLFATLCCKKGKVLFWWLVADDSVGLATNEGQVGYIVGLSRNHACLGEHSLWKDMMELEATLNAIVVKCNRQIGMPVFCASIKK